MLHVEIEDKAVRPLVDLDLGHWHEKTGESANRTERAGLTKSNDSDDRVEKQGENVAYAPDGIKRYTPKILSLRDLLNRGLSTSGQT